ncbi:hypothetical protein RHMOL_Rhmol03G0115700 [Rhododendron molle]|uniref:Uncharacterized protein n=1 Tax=Rhododendron molle TaxID=49168 RepID=A0ACC0PDJ1_RHOML|nr:hypothetical protein RHMOL_Rhmol03G0115700 [Rhododendron molle]
MAAFEKSRFFACTGAGGQVLSEAGFVECEPRPLWRLGVGGVFLGGKELLCKGLKWRIGNGRNISVFRDEWIPKLSNPLDGSPLSNGLPNFKVMDVLDARCHVWRDPLLNVLFPREVVSAIHSIYLPLQEKEDELIWEHTKNGLFSVKLNLLTCYALGSNLEEFLYVNRKERYSGQEVETLEHLFLNRTLTRRVWRASHLGFDFSKDSPVGFNDWFSTWIKEAPDKELIQDSILILWSIWCARNDVVLKDIKFDVDHVLLDFSCLASMCRSIQKRAGLHTRVCEQKDSSQPLFFCFKNARVDGINQGLVSFVSDGAWSASSCTGAAAWVLETGEVEAPYQVVQCKASSATLMEIRAGFMVLQWANQQGLEKFCIKTDCEVFVQGFLDRQACTI